MLAVVGNVYASELNVMYVGSKFYKKTVCPGLTKGMIRKRVEESTILMLSRIRNKHSLGCSTNRKMKLIGDNKKLCVLFSVVDPHLFQCESGSSFFLNADPDPGNQTNADPDPGQTLKSQKFEFLHEKYT
jgi:hypothetical protein